MITFKQFRRLRNKAFRLGVLSDEEQRQCQEYLQARRFCPTCGSDTCSEEAFDQGVGECRTCGKPFCYHCGDGDWCNECVEHEG